MESGVNKKFSEAPTFYWIYTFLILGGASLVLIPHLPLIKLILFSQVANGMLLPFVLIFMLKLVNKTELMGTIKIQSCKCDCLGNQRHHDRLDHRAGLDTDYWRQLEQLARADVFYQAHVGFKKIIGRQLFASRPSERH